MKYFFLFIISFNLYASDYINIPLNKYITIVSKINKINIVLDENIDNKITFLISKNLDKKTYLNVLNTLLDNKDMYMYKQNNFYIIKKKIVDPLNKKDYYTIKLKYVDFINIENFLKVYEESVKYQFVKSSKILLIKASKKDYSSIKDIISKVDILPSQLKLKVTIIDTNIDKLKEFGFENKIQLKNDSDTNFFFNLVAYPFSASNDIPSTKTSKFHTFLKMINDNGSSKFVSSPILTLSDNKSIQFDVATTIPYTKGSTKINDDDSKTTTSIDYKDVGLKISVAPRIYDETLVYLDLDLEVSNILSNVDNIPVVSKKYIKQSFYLDNKKIFILSGINQTKTLEKTSGVPYLMDIPFLGWFFKYESKDNETSNLSIMFEIISNSNAYKQLETKEIQKEMIIIKPIEEENIRLHNERIKEMFNI